MPVTLAPNALTTAEAVYDEMGIPVPEGGASDRVLRLINAVSQRIENYLRRQLGRKTFSTEDPELLQGSGGQWLFLSRWPIEAVEEVLVDGVEVEFGRSDEYDLKGMLHSADGWPRRVGSDQLTGEPQGNRAYNVSVAYTGGYRLPNDIPSEGDIPLPADIELAALNEIVLAYRAPRHHVTSEKTPGGWSRTYGKTGGEAQTGFSRESMRTLDLYRRKFMGNP